MENKYLKLELMEAEEKVKRLEHEWSMQQLENERLKAKMSIEKDVMMSQIEMRNNDLKHSHEMLRKVEEDLSVVEQIKVSPEKSPERPLTDSGLRYREERLK